MTPPTTAPPTVPTALPPVNTAPPTAPAPAPTAVSSSRVDMPPQPANARTVMLVTIATRTVALEPFIGKYPDNQLRTSNPSQSPPGRWQDSESLLFGRDLQVVFYRCNALHAACDRDSSTGCILAWYGAAKGNHAVVVRIDGNMHETRQPLLGQISLDLGSDCRILDKGRRRRTIRVGSVTCDR